MKSFTPSSLTKALIISTIFSILMTPILSECSAGCLSCSDANPEDLKCTLCDFMNNYTLQTDGSCAKNDDSSCKVSDFKENSSMCLKCSKNYHFDIETEKCVSNPDLIDKCAYYNPDKTCLSCESGFIIEQGQCQDLGDSLVQNCVSYESLKCTYCNSGYKLNSENKCEEFEQTIDGCGVYTNLECTQCDASSQVDFLNVIKFKENVLDDDYKNKLIGKDFSKPMFNTDTSKFCLAKKHTNCLESKDSMECNQCLSGFYPDSPANCLPNPVDAIPECKVYSNLSTCLECNPNFWLDGSKCSPSTSVDSCSAYHKTQDKCVSCVDSHFLDGASCSERVNSKDKCLTFAISADTCLTCETSTKYKDVSSICQDRKTIGNCQTYSESKDECFSCAADFRATDDNMKCLAVISECKTYQASSDQTTQFVCDACNDTHYTTDNATCVKKEIVNCKTHKTGNVHQCEVCDATFYPKVSQDACVSQSVQNCAEYTTNTNTCVKCQDLYYINSTACSQVDASSNCLHSDGIANTCTECAGTRFLTNGICESRANPPVANCAMNKEETDDTTCTECEAGFLKFSNGMIDLTQAYMDSILCAEIGSDDGVCAQCAEQAEMLTLGTCTASTNVSSVCLQLTSGTVEALGLNDNGCAQCRDYDTHYLNKQTDSCVARSKFTTSNCKKLDPSQDACLGYELEMTVYNQAYIGHCIQTTKTVDDIPVAQCLFYNPEDLTKCSVCKSGYKLSADGQTCTEKEFDNYAVFVDGTKVIATNTIENNDPAFVDGCQVYSFDIETNRHYCMKCDEAGGKFPVIDIESNIRLNLTSLPITACKTVASMKFYKTAEGVDLATPENCGYFVYNQTDDAYQCISCYMSTHPEYTKSALASDGTTAVVKNVLTSCSSGTISSRIIYFGFQARQEIEMAHMSLVNPGTCSDEAKQLVIFYDAKTLPSRSIEIPDLSTGEGTDTFKCITSVTNSIANCAIHWSPGASTKPVEDAITVSKCLACEKGYKAIADPTTKAITACTQIEDCNSGEHNVCMSCTHGGSTLKFDEANYDFQLDSCPAEENPNAESCLLLGTTDCLICAAGSDLSDDGACVQSTTNVQNSCTVQGMTKYNMPVPTTPFQRLFFNQVSNLFRESTLFLGCLMCNKEFKNSAYTSDIFKESSVYLGHELGKSVLGTIENCKVRKEYTSQKCAECNADSIMKVDDSTCVLASSVQASHPNCATLTTVGGQLVCESCVSTHSLDSGTNMCSIENNCLKYFTSSGGSGPKKCTLCKEGFKVDMGNEDRCVAINNDSEICSQFTVSNLCNKCKDNTKIPINYTNTVNNEKSYQCVTVDATGNSFLTDGNHTLMSIVTDGQTNQSIFNVILTDENQHMVTLNPPFTGYPTHNVCLTIPVDTNCENHYGAYCFKCKNSFLIDDATKMCTQGAIANCEVYQDKNNCSECETGYLKKSDNTCMQRTATNCATESTTQNECATCAANHYLKQNAGDCNSNAANCDECIRYQKDMGCQKMKEDEDLCDECQADHFYDTNQTQCVQRTNMGCKTYEENQDKCKSCETDKFFVADLGECRDPTSVKNCKEYNAPIDKCSTCEDMFFYDSENNSCVANPDGIPGCTKYSSRTECVECGEGMFVDNKKCKMSETAVDNCFEYKMEGKCMTCKSTHFLVGEACEQITNTTCLKNKDVDNCETCAAKKVLKKVGERDECVSLSITNCEEGEMQGESMICTKCKESMLPNDDKLSCVAPDTAITDCLAYDQSSTKASPLCYRCKDNMILSMSKNKCSEMEANKCLHAKELKSNVCMYCGPGRVYKDGDCVECGGQGCLSCDIVDSEKCFVCKPQYSMKTKGVCVETNPDTRPIHAFISNAFYLLLSMVLMIGLKKED